MTRPLRQGRILSILAIISILGARASLAQTDSVALMSGTAASDGTVSLNLVLTSPAGSEPAALQWTFSYPVANVISISAGAGTAAISAGKTVSCAASSGA